MPAIRIRNLVKSYAKTTVLKDIDLDVEDGEFVVLLGPSGCGKSTLLSAIAGLDDIDSGSIEMDGRDVAHVEASQRGIAMVFQSYALYPTMSVRDNLAFGLKVAKVAKAEIERRVAWAGDLLQLTPYLDRRPSQLSGGQRQRVAIGRALVREARVCLFDEPLSNLDAKLRSETRMELKRLHQLLKPAIVYVTHDQIEALTLASRVAVMNGGVIEQYAAPDEIYERPATLFVAGFVGSPSMNFFTSSLQEKDGSIGFPLGDRLLPLASYPASSPLADGRRATLGVRPEHVSLASDDNPASIPARVDFVEPMGSDWLVWFDVGGQRISARLSPAQGRTVRGEVQLAINVAAASLFDVETTRRL